MSPTPAQSRGVVAALWESYRVAVVPSSAPPVQLEETRRAFYAGAGALHSAVIALLSAGADCEDQDLALLDSIDAELNAFAASVGEPGGGGAAN